MVKKSSPQKAVQYKVAEEGGRKILKIDYTKSFNPPNIETSAISMAKLINKLIEVGKVNEVSFLQKEEYVYDESQVGMIFEIAEIIKDLVDRKNIIDYKYLRSTTCQKPHPERRDFIRTLVMYQMKEDPIGAFISVSRKLNELQRAPPTDDSQGCPQIYLQTLKIIQDKLANTRLIKLATPYRSEYSPNNRQIYEKLFKPIILPNFLYTRLVTSYPTGAEELEKYEVDGSDVMILKLKDEIRPLYHITPPEFKLTESKYDLLGEAKQVVSEHKPQKSEFIEPERTREVFMSVERDLIKDISKTKGIVLDYEETEVLANILVRHTIGFGILEVLLGDPKIQDISLNAPLGKNAITIIHQEYGECITNVSITENEGQSWATKLRLISGRPFDEANPVLDTNLILPNANARVAAIQEPLSPSGLAYSIRRHRDKPWTMPLFIKNRMINELAAGLLGFLADGSRTMLIAGTRSSGKTSFLSALLIEIMRTSRIITVEDSVAGDSRIIVKEGGKLKKTTIGILVDNLIKRYGCENKLGRDVVRGNPSEIEILSMNSKGKQIWAQASSFIRHRVDKDIYEVETFTGRKIGVTGDHSLFTIGDKQVFSEAKVKDLRAGDFIAVPRILNVDLPNQSKINLLEHIEDLNNLFVSGLPVRDFVNKNWDLLKELSLQCGYTKSSVSAWKRESILPVKVLCRSNKKEYFMGQEHQLTLKPKSGGEGLPVLINLTNDLLVFIGLWLADGCYDQKSVIMSVSSQEEQAIVYSVANQFNLPVKKHSDGFSLMLNSRVLKSVMKSLKLIGTSYTKQIPEWIYSLSNEQISYVLKGFFSGDGCAGGKEVVVSLASEQLLQDIQTLLLRFGIILRKRNKRRPDKTYNSSISALKFLGIFKDKIGFLQKNKQDKLARLCSKNSTHDTTDVIPFSCTVKEEITQLFSNFNKNDYLKRRNNIGREKLRSLVSQFPEQGALLNPIKYLAESDILWDKVISVKKKEHDGFVYDISVPDCENFICENILAHNTLELPIKHLKDLNYDVQSLKVQSVITPGGGELGAAEGIRTALRLGDSALIIGEVRSKEALALYEAMRVGALANVVAGTIHGDSPYGVYDRVVNDLGVPPTSFKATDIIVIANPVKSASGLKRERRVISITEVRKEWTKDPAQEGGFVDLMVYNPKTDTLEPTDALIQGDSEVVKKIAARIKEWAGDWDAVWANIQLRAKIKKAIVDISEEIKKPEILEAEWVVRSNDEFHKIGQRIEDEVGKSNPDRIYSEWEKWFRAEIKKQFESAEEEGFLPKSEESTEASNQTSGGGEVSGG